MQLILLAALALAGPPDGMLVIPAGEIAMGRNGGGPADQQPRHQVALDAFYLDATLVTVAAFRAFVEETHFRTSAERRGFGMVAEVGMGEWEWQKRAHASWRAPFGDKAPTGFELRDDLPVTMVSYTDAVAYCRARRQRLPTEAEWEYAARAGRSDARFPWGSSPEHDGHFGLNFWQDVDHSANQAADGFVYLSPVRAYPANAFGMFDPVGNVWQLTADFYAEDTYLMRAKEPVSHNPQGPKSGTLRVTRGGSWWCSENACSGFGLFYRGKSRPEAPFNNVGFRCALSVSPETGE